MDSCRATTPRLPLTSSATHRPCSRDAGDQRQTTACSGHRRVASAARKPGVLSDIVADAGYLVRTGIFFRRNRCRSADRIGFIILVAIAGCADEGARPRSWHFGLEKRHTIHMRCHERAVCRLHGQASLDLRPCFAHSVDYVMGYLKDRDAW